MDKKLTFFLLFFISPSIVSFFSLLPAIVINPHNLDYGELKFLGRIINILLFSTVIVFVHSSARKQQLAMPFVWLWFGGLAFLLFSVWHAAAIYGFVDSFPFETRSEIHSRGALQTIVSNRVTGVANEPSYLGPFLVDFLILTLLLVASKVKRTILVSLSFLIIILSLSPSNILVLLGGILGVTAIVLPKIILTPKVSIKTMTYFIFCVASLPVLAVLTFDAFFGQYILFRFWDLSESSRLYMNIMPFIWSFDGSATQFIFGNGIKSYSIIGTEYFLPNNTPVHETSNNAFVDTFWEAGTVGLLLLICFYLYCFSQILFSQFSRSQVLLAAAILGSLIMSQFVRADFASLRVFVMLYLFFLLTHYDMKFFPEFQWRR